jgi:hypothetical protein
MKRNKLGIIIDQWNSDEPYVSGHSMSKHYNPYDKKEIFITRVNSDYEFGTIYLGFFIQMYFKQ